MVYMSLSPSEIAEAVCNACINKVKRPSGKLFLLAILAGAYIGFGGLLATIVTQDASNFVGVGISSILSGMVFSLGLILVVVGGAELFTGNSLITVSYLSKQITLRALLKNWLIVYIGNLIGSLLLVLLISMSGIYASNAGALGVRAVAISYAKVNLNTTDAFIRGILCNWLVCLAIWLSTSAKDTVGKILAVIPPITAFVAAGFEHSIANMYLIPAGMVAQYLPIVQSKSTISQAINIQEFLGNLIPVTGGNIIGGAIFVAMLYWYIYLEDKNWT